MVKFLDFIDDEAKILGNINCISKSNNMICGFNTDKYGFDMLLNENGIDIEGSSCVVLGAGSSAKTRGAGTPSPETGRPRRSARRPSARQPCARRGNETRRPWKSLGWPS